MFEAATASESLRNAHHLARPGLHLLKEQARRHGLEAEVEDARRELLVEEL